MAMLAGTRHGPALKDSVADAQKTVGDELVDVAMGAFKCAAGAGCVLCGKQPKRTLVSFFVQKGSNQ